MADQAGKGAGKSRTAFAPGTLWDAVVATEARALAAGALQAIPTDYEFLEEGGVRFFVRVLAHLVQKAEERKAQERTVAAGKPANPFLPYERDLFVADVSDTHLAILNKFMVVDHHLLIVTREFEEQCTLLTLRDFEALWRCLGEYESLGFYNGGPEAGASQRHKHLQLVPLPLAPAGPPVPIDPLLAAADGADVPTTVPGLNFRHAFVRLERSVSGGQEVYGRYGALLEAAGLEQPRGDGPQFQSGPYCLLATRDWMLLVPRSREHFGAISINALGFAGALLAWNEEQLRAIREAGPLTALRATALPPQK